MKRIALGTTLFSILFATVLVFVHRGFHPVAPELASVYVLIWDGPLGGHHVLMLVPGTKLLALAGIVALTALGYTALRHGRWLEMFQRDARLARAQIARAELQNNRLNLRR